MAGMKMSALLLAVIAIQLASSTPQWSDTLPDGQILYPCAGQSVTFPWEFISGFDDVVTSVKWRLNGLSQETIAIFFDGNFLPLPAFANRARHVGGAGLTLDHVTPVDSGNYSVEVIGHNSSGSSFSLHHSIVLHVTEDLMTTDHALHVRQEAVAEQSNVTDQWHAVLSCGHFTFVGQPAFNVEWQTPTENHTESTYYKDGYFHLLLPNPVTEGTYTCTIPQSFRNDSCVHGDAGKASLVVNAVNARLSVMDARQSESEKQNTALKSQVTALQSDNGLLKSQVTALQSDNGLLKSQVTALQSDNGLLKSQVTALQSDNGLLKSQVAALQSDNGLLKSQVTALQSDNGLLKNQMTKLQEKSDKNIAFHADTIHNHDLNVGAETLGLSGVQTNVGQAYNSSTGVFTVPYSGTYFFIGAAPPYRSPNSANLALVIDGVVVARSYAFQSGAPEWQTGSCHVVTSLKARQRVWLKSERGTSYGWYDIERTFFSGFLISPDA